MMLRALVLVAAFLLLTAGSSRDERPIPVRPASPETNGPAPPTPAPPPPPPPVPTPTPTPVTPAPYDNYNPPEPSPLPEVTPLQQSPTQETDLEDSEPDTLAGIVGTYDSPAGPISIEMRGEAPPDTVAGELVRLVELHVWASGWSALGTWDGDEFYGARVMHGAERDSTQLPVAFWKTSRDTLTASFTPNVFEAWVRRPKVGAEALPKFGEYVYVEELPEAITKVSPSYPPDARATRVEGQVLVQALVGKNGRILDTQVVKSIPMLDAAAVAAVRQWIFKPARSGTGPVAVWVAIPVKFSLH